MFYPKINSLYKRRDVTVDPITGKNIFDKEKKHQLLMGQYSQPEFSNIKYWDVFEEIDGTNIRITLKV